MTYRARPRLFIILTLIALLISLMPQIASDRVFSQDPTPIEPQKIESDDPLVTRVGDWTLQAAPEASSGGYLYNSGEAVAALELPFYGASIAVLYVSGPGLGTLVVEVDGTVLRTVITTAANTLYQQTTRIDYLTEEWHQLRVYAQAGGVIGVDAFVAAHNPIDADDEGGTQGISSNDEGGIQGTPTSVVINEVDMGTPDAIELYNPTSEVIDLTGYNVRTYAYNNIMEVNYTFPTFYIYPGQYVTLREGAGTNTTNTLYMNQNIGNWIHENVDEEDFSGGAVVLSTPYPTPVDFVRWGTATMSAPAGTSFTGTPPNPVFPYTLGRNANSDETDSASDWSAHCGTLGSRNERCLVISEVFYGDPSQIELYNGTDRAVILTGYDLLVYDDPDTLEITYTFPSFTLQPGAFVTLREGTGTDSSTTLYIGQTTGINNTGGAVWLRNDTDVSVDFMRWGAATVAAPAGTSFTGEAIPVPSLVQGSLARRSSLADDDRTSDWCGQVNTLGRANHACVVINEVDMGEPDSIEIYNASTAAYPLDGWQIRLMDSGGNADIPFTVPAFTLEAGSYVRIVEGTGTNTATTLYTTTTISDWVTGAAGAASMQDSMGTTIDYVRWGSAA
ncbi:MAG: lamin tail domain-containing protein, partial [Anaerolineae bacterium]